MICDAMQRGGGLLGVSPADGIVVGEDASTAAAQLFRVFRLPFAGTCTVRPADRIAAQAVEVIRVFLTLTNENSP